MLLRCFIISFCFLGLQVKASDSSLVFKKRKLALGLTCVPLATGSLIYLNQAWYEDYHKSAFHFFDDNDEWLQMDKCGHVLSNYQTARLMMDYMQWAGYKKNTQIFVGGLSGFAYMTAIEMMDAYSTAWGFSWGDMLANAIGTGVAIGQKAIWNQQRIQLKFSFYASPFAQYRPDLLGKSLSTQILKDYNGQTYWLSINPSSFMKQETRFPKWLSFAFGYGADGMLGARYNNILIENETGKVINYNRYRQAYFSLDVDLNRIPVKSKFLKTVFNALNIIKLPFPNIELSEGKFKVNYY